MATISFTELAKGLFFAGIEGRDLEPEEDNAVSYLRATSDPGIAYIDDTVNRYVFTYINTEEQVQITVIPFQLGTRLVVQSTTEELANHFFPVHSLLTSSI
ncbi:MAG: hypothetical protein SP1CHLAM54_12480 [Chlamydiia bacterium]|nr:hypothetical protein [Chlamydiia bacterium]MCH9616146.1 hypothetical protein [Chlamydiia bacterium]MCH9629868.1 hypothetical protein [Chlamydiia bacterium]